LIFRTVAAWDKFTDAHFDDHPGMDDEDGPYSEPQLPEVSPSRSMRVAQPTIRGARRKFTRHTAHGSERTSSWTIDEDDLLRKFIAELPDPESPSWALAEPLFPGRSQHLIRDRWVNVLRPGLVSGNWTPEEDAAIVEHVQLHGEVLWAQLSRTMPTRTGKMLRERYREHLRPTISKAPATPDKEALIIALQREIGNKWTEIAQRIGCGRSDNWCKNRFNSIRRRMPERIPEATKSQPQRNLDGQADAERKPGIRIKLVIHVPAGQWQEVSSAEPGRIYAPGSWWVSPIPASWDPWSEDVVFADRFPESYSSEAFC
jgi:hypothetical protein